MTENFAHRGFSAAYPENTMLSFQKARETGCHGIELDVHLSADGVPVVIHDEQVDRTTDGSGWVGELSFAQLGALLARLPFAAEAGRFRPVSRRGGTQPNPRAAGSAGMVRSNRAAAESGA